MSEWQVTTLDRLGRIVTGKTPPTSEAANYGGAVPFITPSDMDGRRHIDSTGRCLSSKGVACVANARIPKDAVLVSCIGSDMGKAAMAAQNSVTNQQINSIIVSDGFDPRFVYYNLTMRKEEIRSSASGSAQPILNKSAFGRLPIALPSLGLQRAIADVLSLLDDKIDLNRRTNETLEVMARAVFKSWFVDFDPVHAKAAGKAPAHMDAETAALFPDAFGEDGLPEGWTLRRVDEFLELAYGKALKASERADGPVPVYGSGGRTGWHNEALVAGPSVVVGRKGTVGSLYWEDDPFFPIDTTFYVKTETSLHYCFYMLHSLHLDTMNTDAAVPGLNRKNVYRLTFPHPGRELIGAFDAYSALLRRKITANHAENQTLAALRDLLLPKLMSGELRLRDAEKIVEGAA